MTTTRCDRCERYLPPDTLGRHCTRCEAAHPPRVHGPPPPPPPATRAECAQGPRPCPHRGCRYSLPAGACTLDLADRDGLTLREVGAAMDTTAERVRQIEARALQKFRSRMAAYVAA